MKAVLIWIPLCIGCYFLGFYSGLHYQSTDTPKEATYQHIKDIHKTVKTKGAKVIKVLQEESE